MSVALYFLPFGDVYLTVRLKKENAFVTHIEQEVEDAEVRLEADFTFVDLIIASWREIIVG